MGRAHRREMGRRGGKMGERKGKRRNMLWAKVL